MLEARKTANSLTSGAQCQDIEALCEDDLERQQHASLPSLGRFTARYKRVTSPRCLSTLCRHSAGARMHWRCSAWLQFL